MTQQQHPIAPPEELVRAWLRETKDDEPTYIQLADKAAQWSADQELEACRMEIIDGAGLFYIDETSERVRLAEDIWTARRPKPPSLKEEALAQLDLLTQKAYARNFAGFQDDAIRRALESISDPS